MVHPAPSPRRLRVRRLLVPSTWLSAFVLLTTPAVVAAQSPTTSSSDRQSDSVSLPADWQGSAGLLVSVVDERGGPLPDAEVALRPGETLERLVLLTDAEGRAEFTGLKAGEWQVDVRREGFMLLNAYVVLETGKKPKVSFSSRQRTGSYWEPLQAVFLAAGVDLTPGVASGRESVKQAQAKADRASRKSRQKERRAAKASQRGKLARVVPSEPVEVRVTDLVEPAERVAKPEPAATPEPSTVTAAVPEVDSKAAAEVVENETDASETSSSEESPQETRQASTLPPPEPPSSAKIEAPAPAPVTVASASVSDVSTATDYGVLSPHPTLLRNPNLLPAGACPECAPGEFAVAVRGQAEKFSRGARCSLDSLAGVERLASSITGSLVEGLDAFAGSLQESNGNDVLRLLPVDLRVDLRGALGTEAKSCQVVGIVLPKGARYIGFRYQAGERSVMAECPQGEAGGVQNCQVGDSSWLAPPTIVRTADKDGEQGVTLVLGVFENRSKRNTRLPRMVVYFAPPRGWLPPSR